MGCPGVKSDMMDALEGIRTDCGGFNQKKVGHNEQMWPLYLQSCKLLHRGHQEAADSPVLVCLLHGEQRWPWPFSDLAKPHTLECVYPCHAFRHGFLGVVKCSMMKGDSSIYKMLF